MKAKDHKVHTGNQTKKVHVKDETYIDSETGEVLNQVSVSRDFRSKEEFVRVFTKDLCALYDLPKMAFYVMVHIMEKCAFKDNTVSLHKYDKEEIVKKFGGELQSISNAVTLLKKKKVIIPVATGFYIVNANLLFKGKFTSRLDTLNMVVKYNAIEEMKDDKKQ